MNRGITKQHVIVYKLLVSDGRGVMNREAFEKLGREGMIDMASQPFSHDDKEKGGERVSLTNASGRSKRLRGETIDKNRVK